MSLLEVSVTIDVTVTIVADDPDHANEVMGHIAEHSGNYGLGSVTGEIDADFEGASGGVPLADGNLLVEFDTYYRHLEYAPDASTAKRNAIRSLCSIIDSAAKIVESFEGPPPKSIKLAAIPNTVSARIF